MSTDHVHEGHTKDSPSSDGEHNQEVDDAITADRLGYKDPARGTTSNFSWKVGHYEFICREMRRN